MCESAFKVLLSTYQTTLCHNILQYETSLPLESQTIKQLLDRVFLFLSHQVWRGPGSSVGIATDYGLDGPGSNPGGDKIFRLPRLALGPTQPPVKWVPGLSLG